MSGKAASSRGWETSAGPSASSNGSANGSVSIPSAGGADLSVVESFIAGTMSDKL